jgi:hypothetical protein
MNITLEEILMVIISFLIGWFLRTMIGSDKSQQKIKVNTDKHNKNTRANTSVGVGVGDDFLISCDPTDPERGNSYCKDHAGSGTSCNSTCSDRDPLWGWVPFIGGACTAYDNYCN